MVREVIAIVAAVKITTELGPAVGRRHGRQKRHQPLVEQNLVAELPVAFDKVPQLFLPVFHLNHQPMSPSAFPVVNGDRAVKHRRRELIVLGVPPVQRERYVPGFRAEHSGFRHLLHRPAHRPFWYCSCHRSQGPLPVEYSDRRPPDR